MERTDGAERSLNAGAAKQNRSKSSGGSHALKRMRARIMLYLFKIVEGTLIIRKGLAKYFYMLPDAFYSWRMFEAFCYPS